MLISRTKAKNLESLELGKTSDRKKDHIDLAFASRISSPELDPRFFYEPLLSAHPKQGSIIPRVFLGKTFRFPLWVSSMTGGTKEAGIINRNLARAANEFGFGMGLGSCRIILDDDTHLKDFQLRKEIGDEQAFYANLGIAQIENLLQSGKANKINELVDKLDADGLIIHINPLQEWLQPEGDVIREIPIITVKRVMDHFKGKIIVKEVGQGMGPASLKALLELPLAGIELAANGGTNFALLELLRADPEKQEVFKAIPHLGHSAEEMLRWTNSLVEKTSFPCKDLILSGGVNDFLDGYYLMEKSRMNAVYGQASALLKRARGGYPELQHYLNEQIRGYELAQAYLTLREEHHD